MPAPHPEGSAPPRRCSAATRLAVPGDQGGSKGAAPHSHRAFVLTWTTGGFLPLKGPGKFSCAGDQLAPGDPSITPCPHLAQAQVPAPAAVPAAGTHSRILLQHSSLVPWDSSWQLFIPRFNAFLTPSPPRRAPQIPFSSHPAFPQQEQGAAPRIQARGRGRWLCSTDPAPAPLWKPKASRLPQLLCQHQTGTPCSAGR